MIYIYNLDTVVEMSGRDTYRKGDKGGVRAKEKNGKNKRDRCTDVTKERKKGDDEWGY